jgi:hypothetical protein
MLGLVSFIYPHAFLLTVVLVLIGLPIVVGTGLFVFGAIQVYKDREQGIATILCLSASHPQIVLARLVVGTVFAVILVALSALAITCGVITKLIQWPESLVPGGLIDLFVGSFEIGFACYCIGLMIGQNAESPGAAVRAWWLVLIPISLIIAKGLGRPLTVVLVPFVGISLLCLLISARHRRLVAIAVGLAILWLVAIPLYWFRYSSDVMTGFAMLAGSREATIECYHEFPLKRHDWGSETFHVRGEIDAGRFAVYHGNVHFLLQPIGIMSYLRAKEPGGGPVDLRRFGDYYWGYYYHSATCS